MKWGTFFAIFFTVLLEIEGSMLRCGEDIVVQKGEKKKLRFWSTDDELLKVEVLPEREESDGSALLAIFKDLNGTPSSDHRETQSETDRFGGKKENKDGDLSEHLSSRTDLSDHHEGKGEQTFGERPLEVSSSIDDEEGEKQKDSESKGKEELQVSDIKEMKPTDKEKKKGDKVGTLEQENTDTSFHKDEKEEPILDVDDFSNDTEVTSLDQDSTKDNKNNYVTEDSISYLESTTISELSESPSVSPQKESDLETVTNKLKNNLSHSDDPSDLNSGTKDDIDLKVDEDKTQLNPDVNIRTPDKLFKTELETDQLQTTPAYKNESIYHQDEQVNQLQEKENNKPEDTTLEEFYDGIATTLSPTETTPSGEATKTQEEIDKNDSDFKHEQKYKTLLKQDELGVEIATLVSDVAFLDEDSNSTLFQTDSVTETDETGSVTLEDERIDDFLDQPTENKTLKPSDSYNQTSEDTLANDSSTFEEAEENDQQNTTIQDAILTSDENEISLREDLDQSQATESTDISTTTDESFSEDQDELMTGDNDHLKMKDTESMIYNDIQAYTESINAAVEDNESPETMVVTSPSTNGNQKQESTEKELVLPEELDARPQSLDSILNEKETFEHHELKKIMTQLKSQEAQLSRPLLRSEESSTEHLQEEEDKADIDIKISILKNIIKDIASRIATDENADQQSSNDTWLNPTTQSVVKDDSSDFSSSDDSKPSFEMANHLDSLPQENDTQEEWSLETTSSATTTYPFYDESETVTESEENTTPRDEENDVDRNRPEEPTFIGENEEVTQQNKLVEILLPSEIGDELPTRNEDEKNTELSGVDKMSPNEHEQITEIYLTDETLTPNKEEEKPSEMKKKKDEDSDSKNSFETTEEIFKETPSISLNENSESTSSSDIETSTSESLTEVTTGIIDELKQAYNKILDELSAFTTISPNEPEVQNELLGTSLDKEQELKDETKDLTSSSENKVQNKENLERSNKKSSHPPNKITEEKEISSATWKEKKTRKESIETTFDYERGPEEPQDGITEKEQSYNLEEVFIPFDFLNLKDNTVKMKEIEPETESPDNLELTTKDSGTEYSDYSDSTTDEPQIEYHDLELTTSIVQMEDTTSDVSVHETSEIIEVPTKPVIYDQNPDANEEIKEKLTKPILSASNNVNNPSISQDSTNVDEENNQRVRDKEGSKLNYEMKVIKENPIFSKETGSDNVLSLIRNAFLSQKNKQMNEETNDKNIILIPFDLDGEKGSDPSRVIIEEQGSKVVIIKPQSEIRNDQKETPLLIKSRSEAIRDQEETPPLTKPHSEAVDHKNGATLLSELQPEITSDLEETSLLNWSQPEAESDQEEISVFTKPQSEATDYHNKPSLLTEPQPVIISDQEEIPLLTKPQLLVASDQETLFPLIVTTETNDQDDSSSGLTTPMEMEMGEDESLSETTTFSNGIIYDIQSRNDADTDTLELSATTPTAIGAEEDQTETPIDSPAKETFVPFGISIENESPNVSDLNSSEDEIPATIPLADVSASNSLNYIKKTLTNPEPIDSQVDSLPRYPHSVIELLENYVLGDASQYSSPPEDKEFVSVGSSHVNDEHPVVAKQEKKEQQNGYQEFITNMDNIPFVENDPYDGFDSPPIPHILQTRKGFVASGGQNAGQANMPQQRRDDSQYPYGGDSPFFIKLPGSPTAVPVFLQYEPVEVKYVDFDQYTMEKSDDPELEVEYHDMSNDVRTSSSDTDIKENKFKYSPVDKTPTDGAVNFHDRPDPFFLMDPPNLGTENDEKLDGSLPKEDHSSNSVDLKGNLNFDTEGRIPDIVTGDNAVYPGEYLIKNPDNSYSSSDTNHLTNSVFSLGSKVVRPTPEPDTPQYTPFPITPNPPVRTTPTVVESNTNTTSPTISSDTSSAATTSPLGPATTEENVTANDISVEHPPSIEFSPAPSIDYKDSFGPYVYDDIPFNDDVGDEFFEDDPNLYPLAYENNNRADVTPNEEVISNLEPKVRPSSVPPRSNIPPKEDNFDIVALANFLHQNQKVWSSPKVSSMPESAAWRGPSWDTGTIKYSDENDGEIVVEAPFGTSPWLVPEGSLGEGRDYSAFYSPEEIPGLDPAYFSYRSMPFDAREKRGLNHDIESLLRYLEILPTPIRKAVMSDKPAPKMRRQRSVGVGQHIYCEWNIKTEPGLYLLVTFHNLSAPYTIDCHGAYIEVERENNGYDARWCGNRAIMDGLRSRPHVIFARTEVRITVYDNGNLVKSHPTGFEAEIEVIDLFNTSDYNSFLKKKPSPKIRRLLRG